MRYNVLYGILAGDAGHGEYEKHFTRAQLTWPGMELAEMLRCHDADQTKRRLFASAVCAAVLDTQFGNEIVQADPNNTYERPVRGTSSICLYDATCQAEAMSGVLGLLDNDIKERLAAPQWIDVMAAGCLQLLREVL